MKTLGATDTLIPAPADGADGQNAQYYMLAVGASTLKRGASDYVPSSFSVVGYWVDGAEKNISTENFILVYGLVEDGKVHLTTLSYERTFDASVYYDDDYDGFMFCMRTSEASNEDLAPPVTVMVARDGEQGENAQYYVVETDVSNVRRKTDGTYVPSSINVYGRYVNGSAKTAAEGKYIYAWGLYADGTTNYLGRSTDVDPLTLTLSSYKDKDYDGFKFQLFDYDSGTFLGDAMTVTVSRDGNKGYTGARMRVRTWAEGEEYLKGSDDEEWYDVVEYGDLLYLCLISHSGRTSTPQTEVADNTGYWEVAQQWTFIATKLLLSERIKSQMIDTDDLVAKRIYTDPAPDEVDSETGEVTRHYAHIEMSGSEMKVFGEYGMNIRFGVNDEGMAVLEYYDNDGRKLYDLGPDGITDIPVSEESWTAGYYRKLGDALEDTMEEMLYKTMEFSEEYKVYKYHSKVVAGVVDDSDNHGRWFTKKVVSGSYVLEDGIYCMMPSTSAGNYMFMMVSDMIIELALEAGKTELTSEDLDGLTEYNETIEPTHPIYMVQLYRCEGGFLSMMDERAYWNGKPIASEA